MYILTSRTSNLPQRLLCKVPVSFCQILMKLNFLGRFSKNTQNMKFDENPSCGSRADPCSWTDGKTDVTDLIAAFDKYANMPNSISLRWELCCCVTWCCIIVQYELTTQRHGVTGHKSSTKLQRWGNLRLQWAYITLRLVLQVVRRVTLTRVCAEAQK